MGRGAPNAKLKAWRVARGLSMDDAAAKVVIDGEPCSKATWHGWESAGKIPKPNWMIALCDLTGLEPNDFYPRRDGGARARSSASGGNGSPGGGAAGPKVGNGGEPPQMALAL